MSQRELSTDVQLDIGVHVGFRRIAAVRSRRRKTAAVRVAAPHEDMAHTLPHSEKVLHPQMIFPIACQSVVERHVLVVRDVFRGSSPEQVVLVEVRSHMRSCLLVKLLPKTQTKA